MRREIANLEVRCQSCDWTGKFEQYQVHTQGCEFQTPHDVKHFTCTVSPRNSLDLEGPPSDIQCSNYFAFIRPWEFAVHQEMCPVLFQGSQCPLLIFGCPNECYMDQTELNKHMHECQCNHVALLVSRIQLLIRTVETSLQTQRSSVDSMNTQIHTQIQEIQRLLQEETMRVQQTLMAELQSKDDEIADLKATVSKLEKTVKSKNAELEDRDFRLSLIENSNHDGTMIWKIPQFSQRKADADNGKYTSIFSLPFYTGRYGYKMCLRLYIMGDGIGKGTHLSLFFVVMHGEFDNILQWPFTHKVTFKLINQAGGRDIVDTFQPDPMSTSFRKPKSDMNVASGCPRFVSHTELERGGFIVDDTIFIKCMIDVSTICHP